MIRSGMSYWRSTVEGPLLLASYQHPLRLMASSQLFTLSGEPSLEHDAASIAFAGRARIRVAGKASTRPRWRLARSGVDFLTSPETRVPCPLPRAATHANITAEAAYWARPENFDGN